MIKGHKIERSLEWVGIACEPGLPRVNELWDWDVVVRFPVPRKAGKVKTMPAVVWNVPDSNVIIHEVGKNGLMQDQEHLRWETAAKWERAAQFGNYIKTGKSDELDPGTMERWLASGSVGTVQLSRISGRYHTNNDRLAYEVCHFRQPKSTFPARPGLGAGRIEVKNVRLRI